MQTYTENIYLRDGISVPLERHSTDLNYNCEETFDKYCKVVPCLQFSL